MITVAVKPVADKRSTGILHCRTRRHHNLYARSLGRTPVGVDGVTLLHQTVGPDLAVHVGMPVTLRIIQVKIQRASAYKQIADNGCVAESTGIASARRSIPSDIRNVDFIVSQILKSDNFKYRSFTVAILQIINHTL